MRRMRAHPTVVSPVPTGRAPVSWLEAILLGILQGLTEFLPISSSAHLAIFPQLFGTTGPRRLLHRGHPDRHRARGHLVLPQGHLADRQHLAAVAVRPGAARPHRRPDGLVHHLGTIPIGDRRRAARGHHPDHVPQPVGDRGQPGAVRRDPRRRRPARRQRASLDRLNLRDALLYGGAQMLALVPGVSRSGATISMGLALGLHPRGGDPVRLPAGHPRGRRLGHLPAPRRQRQRRARDGQDPRRPRSSPSSSATSSSPGCCATCGRAPTCRSSSTGSRWGLSSWSCWPPACCDSTIAG